MELIRHLSDLDTRGHDCVATIGNFDGFHLGHQAVLSQLHELASIHDLPMSVLVFEPQPMEYFRPDQAPARLTRWREKYQLFKAYGVNRMICLRFDASLADMRAEDFIQHLLIEKLRVKHLLIGDDFRFGQARKGDFNLLNTMSVGQFSLSQSESFLIDQERVSSSRIRQALEADDLALAARLLGRKYSISGRVVRGEQRGRELGFPTANIELKRMKTALHGIFIAQVDIKGQTGLPHPAVAYIGSKPTLGGSHTVLETHLLNYQGNLYGSEIRVEFIAKLRDDKRFDSFEALRTQIDADVRTASHHFDTQRQP